MPKSFFRVFSFSVINRDNVSVCKAEFDINGLRNRNHVLRNRNHGSSTVNQVDGKIYSRLFGDYDFKATIKSTGLIEIRYTFNNNDFTLMEYTCLKSQIPNVNRNNVYGGISTCYYDGKYSYGGDDKIYSNFGGTRTVFVEIDENKYNRCNSVVMSVCDAGKTFGSIMNLLNNSASSVITIDDSLSSISNNIFSEACR